MAIILVLNGPNLNLLGTREPELYGNDNLASIQHRLEDMAKENGHQLVFMQSNAEHELIDRIHQAREQDVAAIDIVAITHFHGDHIGGMMEDGSPAFPNASYVIGQEIVVDGGLTSTVS